MRELADIRKEIEEIDSNLIELLKRRVDLAPKIGEVKHLAKVEIEDPIREDRLLKKYQSIAKQKQINPKFITRIFKEIFTEMKNLQEKDSP